MSTITNVALNFTKEELIARLRAVLPIAKGARQEGRGGASCRREGVPRRLA